MTVLEKSKILITVKTYPNLSTKHTETVCTAGFREDGSWVRIYPISYRHMEKGQKFGKYQWIEADIVRDTRDPRPESYKLTSEITPLNRIDTKNQWLKRKDITLQNVYTDLAKLIDEARDISISTSLAVFKPHKIIAFHVEKVDSKLEKSISKKQLAMQLDKSSATILADKVPYKFYYTIIDENGKRSRMQILDWEIYQLCRKLIRKYGQKKHVIYTHLKAKYFDEFTAKRDIHLFLGTNRYWHIRRSKNPFMIVGVFYPPKDNE